MQRSGPLFGAVRLQNGRRSQALENYWTVLQMKNHLESQGTGLLMGINAFEPYIYKMHQDFDAGAFKDWPTVVLATTLQASAVSLFKVLPPLDNPSEMLDKRSIASLVRNLVDTHDVVEMLVTSNSEEEWTLHRDILGLYISSRIHKVQNLITPEEAQKLFPHTKSWYWNRIRSSSLFNKKMSRLKDGEQIFYRSRRERVELACGGNTDFVLAVLTDLSSFVHSLPVQLWFGDEKKLYSNTKKNQDMVAVWLRVANFYLARSFGKIMACASYKVSKEVNQFTNRFQSAFD